jgi:glycerophosphoryl diester phosphodiesterase
MLSASFPRPPSPIRPRIVAHRGGAGLAPENTLAACRCALGLGVDAIEVDVRLTSDGVPVALHDATLERTTGAQGRLAEWPAADLRPLDASAAFPRHGPPEAPPTLAAVLALVAGHAALQIELKGEPHVSPALVQAVVHTIHEQAPDAAVEFISFDWPALQLARRLAPTVPRGALIARWPFHAPAVLAGLAAARVTWLGLHYAGLTPARRTVVRAAGLRLGVWTVNHPRALRRLLALDVDAITTDRPDRLLALLASASPTP